MPLPQRTCDPCGNPFTPAKPDQLSCSKPCGQRRRAARVGREWYQAQGRKKKPRARHSTVDYRAGYAAGYRAGRLARLKVAS